MNDLKTNCFAYKEFSHKPYCNALNELNCVNCPFFKDKKEVVNNIFYKESFKSYADYTKALEKYTIKYGTGYLEDFENKE